MSHVRPSTVGVKKLLPGSGADTNAPNNHANPNSKSSTDAGTNGHSLGPASDAPKLPPKPVREQVRVIFSYLAQNDDELTIKEGDIITIISKENEDVGWWKGELNGRIALFPDNFIEPYQPPQAAPHTGVRSITAEMNNNSQPPAPTGEKPGLSSLKKPERPSSLAKPAIGGNNNVNEPTDSSPGVPALTPTSPASPAPNSVASKKLKFAQLSSQFQQNNPQPVQPKPVVSLTNNTTNNADMNNKQQTNSNNKEAEDGKKAQAPKTPEESGEPGRLVHLTTLRPKIPTTSRRPPSMPSRTSSLLDEPSSPSLDGPLNGNTDFSSTDSLRSPTKEPAENGTIPATAIEKKPVPWLNDLVMAQKRRNPVKPPAPTSGSSTTTTNGQSSTISQPVSVSSNNPLPVPETKPITSNKPTLPVGSTKSLGHHNQSGDDDSTGKFNKSSPSGESSATNSIQISAKDLEAIAELKEQFALLKSEMRELKSKNDKLESLIVAFNSSHMSQEELIAMKSSLENLIQEQKDSAGAQKKALFDMVKDLINENSDCKKKIANLEIELDRMRKLNSSMYDQS